VFPDNVNDQIVVVVIVVLLTGDDDDAVAVSDEVAAGRVAVDEGLTPHADEEQAFVAGVDETEHGDGHAEGEEDGHGEPHHDPEPEVVLGTHFFIVSDLSLLENSSISHIFTLIRLPPTRLMINNVFFQDLLIFSSSRDIFSIFFVIFYMFCVKLDH